MDRGARAPVRRHDDEAAPAAVRIDDDTAPTLSRDPAEASPGAIRTLQRAAGNSAVSRLLRPTQARLMRLVTVTPEDQTAIAEQLRKAGDYNGAEDQLRRVLRVDRQNLEASKMLERIRKARESERYRDALQIDAYCNAERVPAGLELVPLPCPVCAAKRNQGSQEGSG